MRSKLAPKTTVVVLNWNSHEMTAECIRSLLAMDGADFEIIVVDNGSTDGSVERLGACSAQVILSDSPILYPYVTQPDILVVMSQEAYGKFAPELKEGGTLVIEQDLVRVSHLPPGTKVLSCPATRLAEELGKKMVLNIVMVGFFAAVTSLVKPECMRQAVADSVPPAFKELNLKAFDKGFEYGQSHVCGEAATAEESESSVKALEVH